MNTLFRLTRGLSGVALVMSVLGSAMVGQSIPVEHSIVVGDGTGRQQVLRFGLAPAATNGIDAPLGESECPPLPPSGVFDARFVGTVIGLPLGEGVLRDYRPGDGTTPVSHLHQLRYQCGTGTQITLEWDLPGTVQGRLRDVYTGTLIDVPMSGKGSTVITNPGVYSTLRMTVDYSVATSRSEATPLREFALHQNYPNPFNPFTQIRFSVENEGEAVLRVFDILGEEVATLFNGEVEPGRTYVVDFDGSDLSSGLYIARLTGPHRTAVVKMMLER